MSCKYDMDPVYLDLMNQRTQHDKEMIQQYNCVSYQKKFEPSIVGMLAPSVQKTFNPVTTFSPSVHYQLNPTTQSIANAKGNDSNVNSVYPPTCGFNKFVKSDVCDHMTPYSYPALDFAYNPTSGSRCINLGQDLNLQYNQRQ